MPTSLPTRQLGRADFYITRVGFGAWAIGGGGWSFGWGPQDDNDSVAAIRRALELGVNWIDTAAVDQVDGWIDAATLVLSSADLHDIATAIADTGAGHGPQLPAALAA
jgi:hypothetical protein